MRPKSGVTRCERDCPNRAPGCHNVKTCESWRKQVEENRERLARKRMEQMSKRMSWEERGVVPHGK